MEGDMDESLARDLMGVADALADAAGEITLLHFRTELAADNKEVDRFDPVTVADRLSETRMREILAQPALRERLAGMGVEPMGGTPAEFATFRDSEIKKWGEVVRRAGVTID